MESIKAVNHVSENLSKVYHNSNKNANLQQQLAPQAIEIMQKLEKLKKLGAAFANIEVSSYVKDMVVSEERINKLSVAV